MGHMFAPAWQGDPGSGTRPAGETRRVGNVTAQPMIGSYNVHKCVGTDGRFDPERTARVIAEMKVDILAVQEADTRFGERRPLLDCTDLRDRCGLSAVPLMNKSESGWHGNRVFLREGIVQDVHQVALPSLEPRGALIVKAELSAGPVLIVATHLGLLRRSRLRQAQAILRRLTRAAGDLPILLLGDLNEWRLGARSSLSPLGSLFGAGTATVASFPSVLPVLPLDRILGRPAGLIAGIEAHDTPLARLASDHLPVKARLVAERLGERAAIRPEMNDRDADRVPLTGMQAGRRRQDVTEPAVA